MMSGVLHTVAKTKSIRFTILAGAFVSILFLSSCSNDSKDSTDNPENTPVAQTACKTTPTQIMYGRQIFDLTYNAQNKPSKLVTTITNEKAPWETPVKTVYTIEYNTLGKPAKISKTIADQLEKYYALEYNSKGEVIKQTEFNAQGVSTNYTAAEYTNGVLVKITNHNTSSGTDIETTTSYEYTDGNLVKKTISNLYLADTKGYHDLEFKYTFYQDKETKIKPLFDGLAGLCFISNVNNSASLQYLPKDNFVPLYYFEETISNKNMIKNIQITSNHPETQGDTTIDYSYTFDSEGYPVSQKGNLKSTTYRSEPTQFGVPILITTPVEKSFDITLNYSCN